VDGIIYIGESGSGDVMVLAAMLGYLRPSIWPGDTHDGEDETERFTRT